MGNVNRKLIIDNDGCTMTVSEVKDGLLNVFLDDFVASIYIDLDIEQVKALSKWLEAQVNGYNSL